MVRGTQSTRREPTCARGEHENSTQAGFEPGAFLNAWLNAFFLFLIFFVLFCLFVFEVFELIHSDKWAKKDSAVE